MEPFIIILALIGAVVVGVGIVWPIIEAVLFGVLDTWLTILNAGWQAFHPRHWWWLIRWPWVKAWHRLFGQNRYTASQTMGEWVHIPPFKLYRVRKKR